MAKAVSLALLVGGIVLLIFGFNAMESFSSEVSRVFTGTPTEDSIWMFVGGLVLTIVGLIGLMRGGRAA
ncbi:MAG: DUF3185 family protein [Opitutales bacterium]|nr:DUF3185 family protein [Opitutales bacterium]